MWNSPSYPQPHNNVFPVVIAILAVVLAFEIWMIVDAIKNKQISNQAKAWWVLGMLIIHPIVAIIYYFTDHRKNV